MRRRTLVATGVAAALLACAPLATAAPSLYPKSGCFDFADPAGDAHLAPTATAQGMTTPSEPNAAGADITGVALRTGSDVLSFYAAVPGLVPEGPQRGTGDAWTASFTSNKHTVELKVSRFAPFEDADGLWDANNPSEWLNTVYVDGTDVHGEADVRGEFDTARKLVIISVARASLEGLVGPLGDVTAVSVKTYPRVVYSTHDFLVVSNGPALDTAAVAAKAVLNIDANHCF